MANKRYGINEERRTMTMREYRRYLTRKRLIKYDSEGNQIESARSTNKRPKRR